LNCRGVILASTNVWTTPSSSVIFVLIYYLATISGLVLEKFYQFSFVFGINYFFVLVSFSLMTLFHF